MCKECRDHSWGKVSCRELREGCPALHPSKSLQGITCGAISSLTKIQHSMKEKPCAVFAQNRRFCVSSLLEHNIDLYTQMLTEMSMPDIDLHWTSLTRQFCLATIFEAYTFLLLVRTCLRAKWSSARVTSGSMQALSGATSNFAVICEINRALDACFT